MGGEGTGRPLVFKCAKCRKTRIRGCTQGDNYRATGRTRRLPRGSTGAGRSRNTNRLVEYRCLVCGHTGWSKHRDMERALKKLGQLEIKGVERSELQAPELAG